ncbi:MAG: phosphatidylinositol-specific phospholipase C domain-containing protein [Spirulina sp. SIO3F2]|nr:phosphatidylinositol-specific phospholipase C domain-containing protein [Spirulina sp. SIO3F2]
MEILKIVYKETQSNNLYTAYYDGSQWHGNEKIEIASEQGSISPQSEDRPRVTVFHNYLYVVYKQFNALHVAWFDGTTWLGDLRLSDMLGNIDITPVGCPNIVVYRGLIYTVYKKRGADDALYVVWFDGTTWYGNEIISIGERRLRSPHNPSMVVFDNLLHIIYKSSDSGKLHTAVFNGTDWWGNTPIHVENQQDGISVRFNPSSVLFNDRIYIFYSVDTSNQLYSAWYDGNSWSGGIKIKEQGGNIDLRSLGSPSAEVYDGKIYIVYRFNSSSTSLYSAWYDGQSWSRDTSSHSLNADNADISLRSSSNPGMAIFPTNLETQVNWMGNLSDEVLISEINIPGSHDAAAINTYIGTPYACHNQSITSQLKKGIRLLDIRLQINLRDHHFEFMTCHGSVGSSIGINTYQTFRSLLNECKDFLENHPTEVVIMSLKVDDWSDVESNNRNTALTKLCDLLQEYPTTQFTYLPHLREVPGKIFLYNRITQDLSLGVPISWPDNTDGVYAYPSSHRVYQVYVQDRYQGLPLVGSEQEKFTKVRDACEHKNENSLEVRWNFASATWNQIFGVYIMDELLDYFGVQPASDRLQTFGWVLFDYPFTAYHTDKYGAINIVDLIISSNFNPRYRGYDETFSLSNGGHNSL